MIDELVKISRRNGRELIFAEMAETLNIHQDKQSQTLKFGELVKQSDRDGREWIVAEIAETLNIRQDKHSQRYLILETVNQSSRNGGKLIIFEKAETLLDIKTNTRSDTRFGRLSNNSAEME